MNDYKFGNFIYQLRTQKGITQDDLGRIIGVTNKAISKWENGAAKPRIEVIKKLADYFDVSVDELLHGKRKFEPTISEQPPIPKAATYRLSRLIRRTWIVGASICAIAAVTVGFLFLLPSLKQPSGSNPADPTPPEHKLETETCSHKYVEAVHPATCTEGGYTEHTCKVCGDSYRDSETEPLGHNWTTALKDDGCIEGMVIHKTCSRCYAETLEHTGDAGTHQYTLKSKVLPTRTTGGYDLYACKYCGREEQRNPTSPVSYSVGLTYKKVNGSYYASDMGTCKDNDLIIPAVNEYGQTIVGVLGMYEDNSWTSTAVSNVKSLVISEGIKDIHNLWSFTNTLSMTLPLSCPQDSFSAFPKSGKVKEVTLYLMGPVSQTWETGTPYQSIETVHLIGSYHSEASLKALTNLSMVTVPDSWTTLPKEFCYGQKKLTSFTFPSSLKTISDYCFEFSGLTEANLPNGVTTIGYAAFKDTPLTSVNLPESLVTIDYYAFKNTKLSGALSLPTHLKTVGSYAFTGTLITSVTIPDSVTEASYAFRDCTALKSVTVGGGLNNFISLFYGCTSLTSAILSDSLTKLDKELFCGCTKLSAITFPTGLTEIKDSVFSGCSSLSEIQLPGQLKKLGNKVFYQCTALKNITVPEMVTSLGSEIFYGCSALESCTLLCAITEIPKGMVQYCSKLTTFQVPDVTKITAVREAAFRGCSKLNQFPYCNVKTLENYAFAGTSVTEVTVPEGVTDVSFVFSGCKQLISLILPESLLTMKYCVENCSALTELTLPKNLQAFSSSNLSGCTLLTKLTVNSEKQLNMTEGTNAIFAQNVTLIIGEGASIPLFYSEYIKNIASVVLPSTLLSIPENAFSGASKLKSVVLPNGLLTIGKNAFANTGLESVVFPSTVTSVGEYAFYKCLSLTSVDFSGAETSLGGSVFSGDSQLSVLKNAENITTLNKTDIVNTPLMDPKDGLVIVGKFLLNVDIYTVPSDLIIPNEVKVISNKSFINCTTLRSVKLHSGITEIGESAFDACVGLIAIDWNGCAPRKIGNFAFRGCRISELVLPAGVETWGTNVFEDCVYLAKITIPDGMTEIPDGFFKGCTNLKTAVIGKDLKKVGANAFAFGVRNYDPYTHCCTLSDITFAGTLAQFNAIEWGSGNMFHLEKTTVYASDGKTLEVLRSAVKSGVKTALMADETLTFTGSGVAPKIDFFVGSIGERVLKIVYGEGITRYESNFSLCPNVQEVVFSSTVTTFPSLSTMTKLQTVVFSEGTQTIPSHCVWDCEGEILVVIPDSVKQIASDAFNGNVSLCFNSESEKSVLPSTSSFQTALYSENLPTISGLFWHWDENGKPVFWD